MVVTNCAVLTEGFDEPNVSCIIIARPTKSKVLYVQMIGRGIRTYPGKEDCLVLDLVGNSSRLDLVTVPRLFGIDEKDAKEGVAAAKMREVELAQQLIGETAATQIVAAPGELESQVVDLFGRQEADALASAPRRPLDALDGIRLHRARAVDRRNVVDADVCG